MLFSFIYLYWCSTLFQCQIMFLSYYRKTRNVTSITETSYTNPPEHLSSPLVLCRVRVVQSLVFCAVCYISQFFLCQFPLAMILSVFCQLHFGHDIVCLFRCTASGYLFDIFKPLLHSCENRHMPVICFLKWVHMVYIFRQYMHLLLINCQGNVFIFCSLCCFWLGITYG